MQAVLGAISQLGMSVLLSVASLGRFTQFAGSTFRWFTQVRKWCRWRLLAPQFYAVGVQSVLVVAITGAFIGMILAIEMYDQFRTIGQEGKLGGVINISVVKQIGPVLAAVMVAGRVGGALAAELGTMRVTEQLDAMRAMAADPIAYLVVPRVVACVVMTPLLTIYSDMLGVWGAWLITVRLHGVSVFEYWEFTSQFVDWWEPTSGLIKSVFFGLSIGLISCYKGFNCSAGASGVGRAATEAFVASFLAIIAINLVLAQFLNTVNYIFITRGDAAGFV
ncbi:MAG TPA: ABC transporter permease [Phycisphaerales bacterium]|nr:ABC transporter permease [Phycisphaerales bacterium]